MAERKQSEGKGCLPYGWQVRTSKRYPDRIYYFNIVTGCSTWECPELDPPRTIAKEVSRPLHSVIPTEGHMTSLPSAFCQKTKRQAQTKGPNVDLSLVKKVTESLLKLPKERHVISVPDNSKPAVSEIQNSTNSVPDDLKSHAPPTAVVVPVIHSNEYEANLAVARLSYEKELLAKRKASSDSVHKSKKNKGKDLKNKIESSSSSDTSKKKKKKKKKISPLNRPESNVEKETEVKNKKVPTQWSIPTSLNISDGNTSDNLEIKHEDEDIEMLDVSMEIMEEITAKKETVVDTLASYYIVVDTNVLIHNLHFINELKDTPLDGCGPPHVFIPWVVIEELDKLKSNRNSEKPKAMRAAIVAVRYLNSVLGKHPRFHGQSPAEAENWAKTYYSGCNDNRLLECCIALADKMSQEKVILLTNDKNLVNKALICNIKVHDIESMMKSVKPDVVFKFSKNAGVMATVNESQKTKSSEASSLSIESTEEQMIVCQRDTYKKEIHNVMCSARQLLKNVLQQFVEQEMYRAWGDTWRVFPVERHLLEGLCRCIIKYWKTAFSETLNNKALRSIELLLKKAERPDGFLGDKEECLVILSAIEDVCQQIKKKCPKINVSVGELQAFRTACIETFSTYCELENTIKDAEQANTLAVFERNWSAINQLCGMILDHCKIPHDFQYDKPAEIPPESEIRELLCNSYLGVKQLKVLMHNIIHYLNTGKSIRLYVKKLYAALKAFIPSLEIPYQAISYPHFSVEALEKFCNHGQNREMIEIGYKQIEKFFSKLDEALNFLMALKYRKGCKTPEDTMICE